MPYLRLFLPALLSLIAGALAACAFAPLYQPEFSAIALLILICVWHRGTPKQTFWAGLFFGIGLYGTGASWIQISIHIYGGAPWLISTLITACFVLYLSLFPAFTGFVWRRIQKPHHPVASTLILLPCLWVLFEWLRGALFTGFPWLFQGYALINLPLRGWGPLIGVYGLSWLTVFLMATVFLFIHQRNQLTTRRVVGYVLCWVVAWGGGWLLMDRQWTHPTAPPQQVAMIQGNVDIEHKWSNLTDSLSDYLNDTRQLAPNHDVVIWPETAVAASQVQVASFLNQLNQFGLASQTAIVTGIPWQDTTNKEFFNALVTLGWDSRGVYLKRHLVPFGEYPPSPSLFKHIIKAFSLPMSGFNEGPAEQPLLVVNGHPVASFICYEIAYPSLVLETARSSAWLLVASDDAWFGESWAAAQQLEIAQMRSLETGRPTAYATNNGITAFIDTHGQIVAKAPVRQRAILAAALQPVTGNTPLMLYTHTSILALILILLMISAYIVTGKDE